MVAPPWRLELTGAHIYAFYTCIQCRWASVRARQFFLDLHADSHGVRHDQKSPLRLGSTSFGPIPELPSNVFFLKIH